MTLTVGAILLLAVSVPAMLYLMLTLPRRNREHDVTFGHIIRGKFGQSIEEKKPESKEEELDKTGS